MVRVKEVSETLFADMRRRESEEPECMIMGLVTEKGEYVAVITTPVVQVYNTSGLRPIADGRFNFRRVEGRYTLVVYGDQRSQQFWVSPVIVERYSCMHGRINLVDS